MNSMILAIFIDKFGFCKENYRFSYHCLLKKILLFDFGKLMKVDSGMFVCYTTGFIFINLFIFIYSQGLQNSFGLSIM